MTHEEAKQTNPGRRYEIIDGDEITTQGFVMMPNCILRDPDLGHGAKITFAVMLSIARRNTNCTETQSKFAKIVGASIPSLNKWCDELAKAGYVQVTKRGLGRPNDYKLMARVSKNQRSQKYQTTYTQGHGINLDGADNFTRLGYTQIPNFILEIAKLKSGHKICYALLLSHAWGEKRSCEIKQATLAHRLGVERQQVNLYIKKLSQLNLISVHNQGKMHPCIYTLNFKAQHSPKPPTKTSKPPAKKVKYVGNVKYEQ